MRGEAIVNSPLDALECFLFTDLDYLVMGDFLIAKSENREHWLDLTYDEYLGRRRDRYVAEFKPELQRVHTAIA